MRLALLLVLALLAVPLAAQPADPAEPAPADTTDAPRAAAPGALRGVTWTPPEDVQAALADLRQMAEAGVEAVRLPYTEDRRILRGAELAGIALYVDLPVSVLSARALRDTTAFAQRQLDALAALAPDYPALRGVGLADGVDTSVPEACAYFEALAPRAREAGLWTYYRSRFVESDGCGRTVDAVLLDARTRDPAAVLARWRAVQSAPAGIGAFGAPARDGAAGGHLTPRTLAAQQRTLEDGLRRLRRMQPPPAAVFIHTWNDGPYGLHAADGTPRPARDVVGGFYTGRQTVFAVDAGAPPPSAPGATGFVLFGWALAVLLLVLMAVAPRFRLLVPRYFTRHGYYREAVQRGGGLEGFAAFGVALALAGAAGVIGGVALDALAQTDVLDVALAGLGEAQRTRTLGLLGRVSVVVPVLAVAYGFWLLLNMVWLLALTGRRHRIRPGQALALVTMSRWPVFVLAVLALLAAQAETPMTYLPALLGVWLVAEIIAGARMLYDFARVSRVPMPRATLVGLGVPLALLAVAALGILITGGAQVGFLWHLATRT